MPHVAGIPAAEFSPTARSFGPSVVQFIVTGGLMVPQVLSFLLAATAGPAHTSVFADALARDQQRFAADQQMGRGVAEAKRMVELGYVDHVGMLDRLRQAISAAEMPNEGLAALTRQLVEAIDSRKAVVLQRYRREGTRDRALLDIFKIFDRGAF